MAMDRQRPPRVGGERRERGQVRRRLEDHRGRIGRRGVEGRVGINRREGHPHRRVIARLGEGCSRDIYKKCSLVEGENGSVTYEMAIRIAA